MNLNRGVQVHAPLLIHRLVAGTILFCFLTLNVSLSLSLPPSPRRESKSKSLVLLKAVEAKLFDTFCSSKYHTVFDFKAAFSFHIPAADFEQALKDGPIWKLGSVGLATADDAEARDKPEAVLLKTKLLTDPRMKTWAASNPQMKEVRCVYVSLLVVSK